MHALVGECLAEGGGEGRAGVGAAQVVLVEDGRRGALPAGVLREEPLLVVLVALHQGSGEERGARDGGECRQCRGHRTPHRCALSPGKRVELGPLPAQFLPQLGRYRRAHPVQEQQQDPAPRLGDDRRDDSRQEGLDGEQGTGGKRPPSTLRAVR